MAFRNLPDMKPSNKPQFAGYGFQFEDGGSSAPVQSVNGKTGAVVLDATDVGAPTAESVITSFNSVNGKIGDINDNIAPTESTDTASQAYTVGQYFINKDGVLCRCTVDIPSGGTIVVNTNCINVTITGDSTITLFDTGIVSSEANKTNADILQELFTAISTVLSSNNIGIRSKLIIVRRVTSQSNDRIFYPMGLISNSFKADRRTGTTSLTTEIISADYKYFQIDTSLSTGSVSSSDISSTVFAGQMLAHLL